MITLSLYSEQYQPQGGATAQGLMKALGRPRLDHVSVLVREAVQNSWDARIRSENPATVSVAAKLETCSSEDLENLKKQVFREIPAGHPLADHLEPGMLRLVIEDRGTVGLGGPVFVERAPESTDRFINFCRLFGRAAEGALGGGTYGYGKAAYFGASQAATVIIHTRCRKAGGYENRLIAMSLSKAEQGVMDTGRHWWGIPSHAHQNVTGPVIGEDAARLAGMIGFSEFTGEDTGTSIMILAPRFDDEALEKNPVYAAGCIAESMVIWFWPRMLGLADKEGVLQFQVTYEGRGIPIPNPDRDIPFIGYKLALENLKNRFRENKEIHAPAMVDEIESRRPKARLGYLSLALNLWKDRPDYATGKRTGESTVIKDHVFMDQLRDSAGSPSRCHHVALVREPGQVIKYLPCNPYPDSSVEYFGIFLVDGDIENEKVGRDDVNFAFALAEPPSHDDWIPNDLANDWHRTYVKVALRRIEEQTRYFTELGNPQVQPVHQDPLGALSASLGELMSAPGQGARHEGRQGGARGAGGGGGGKMPIQIKDNGHLEEIDGKSVFVLSFTVKNVDETGLVVRAKPHVLLAGGRTESDAPEGDAVPVVIGWLSGAEGAELESAQELRLKQGDSGNWTVRVSVPAEAMIGVSLSAESGQ